MPQTLRTYLPPFLALTAVYFFASMVFSHFFGYFSPEGVFLFEKALIAVHGAPPQLENIGLVYPPLPFICVLPFAALLLLWGPQLVSAAAAALLVTLVLVELRTLELGPTVEIVFLLTFLLHPLVLYVATLGSSSILYTLLGFTYIYSLLRYSYLGKTFNLVFAGLTIMLMAFVRYEIFFFLLFIFPVIHVVGGGLRIRTPWGVSALLLMNLVPPVIAFLSWIYLNWLFTGDALHFLHSPHAYFRNIELFSLHNIETLKARNSVVGSLSIVLRQAAVTVPAFFFVLVSIRNFSIVWFFTAPLLALALAAFLGLSLLHIDAYVLLLPLIVLLVAFDRQRFLRWRKTVLIGLLAASLPLTLWYMSESWIREEREFARMLLGHSPPTVQTAEQQMARFIVENVGEGKIVLLDDASGYAIVAFSKEPQRFLLPYQYSFRPALISPQNFVDGILVADPRSAEGRVDLLNQFHENVYHEGLVGTRLVMDSYPWRLYLYDREGSIRNAVPAIQ